mgnify:CR=1 FL=1
MDKIRTNWKDAQSDQAKRNEWAREFPGVAPHDAWYYSPAFGAEGLTDELCEGLRVACWGPTKTRVIKNVDAKVDDSLMVLGDPTLRVTMPERFVPSFDAGGRSFFLLRVTRPGRTVDFSRIFGGTQAVSMGRSPKMTIVGDIGSVVDPTEMPAPRGMLRVQGQNDPRLGAATDAVPSTRPVRAISRPRLARPPHDPEVPQSRIARPTIIPSSDGLVDSPARSKPDVWKAFGDDGDDEHAFVVPARRNPEQAAPNEPADEIVPPVNYGHVAAMSSFIGIAVIVLCYAAWVFLSSS